MKTIYEQTGWVRRYPVSLCQDLEVLERITDCCFDLRNDVFRKYVRDRLGMQYEAEAQDVFDQDRVTFIGECPEHDPFYWKAHCVQRGKLQDCWELLYHVQGIDEDQAERLKRIELNKPEEEVFGDPEDYENASWQEGDTF